MMTDEEKWNSKSDEERKEILLSYFKEPDNAEKYFDTKWNKLPEIITNAINLKESETSEYKVPNNAVKVPDGDTGFALVKKNYNRFIWTWNQYAGKKPNITNESATDAAYLGEIPGMGSSDSSFGPKAVGYSNANSGLNQQMVPTDELEDPDEKKKREKEQLKHVKKFKDYSSAPITKEDEPIKKKKSK